MARGGVAMRTGPSAGGVTPAGMDSRTLRRVTSGPRGYGSWREEVRSGHALEVLESSHER